MKAVGVYARISSDALGEGLGVTRQVEDCQTLAQARGWQVVDVFEDNDLSAFSGKRRPAYERMLVDVRSGRITGILAWHTDRLHRSPKELEAFIDLCDQTGCTVDTVQAGPVDLSTPSGRVMARTLGAFARYESEHKSERVRRKLQQNAEAGKHHGGSRPYGWEDDRVTLRPDEAAVVRLAARRLLAGASMKTIVRELNAAGARNTRGGPWQHATVRNTLGRPRNAALRVHHGQVIGDGQWEPILTVDEWSDVHRILTDPTRRTTPGALGRTRLLSGIATCGVCGGPLRAGRTRAVPGRSTGVPRGRA
ncbi:MAG: recombinase family protein [Actinomycetes bacterium]